MGRRDGTLYSDHLGRPPTLNRGPGGIGMSRTSTLKRLLLPIGGIALGISLMTPAIGYPQAPDNTRKNKQTSPSADDQKMNVGDRETTQKIRKAIRDDSNLSTYAQNIKIITQDGKVTLRGPVRTEEEKSELGAKAKEVVGARNVTNLL